MKRFIPLGFIGLLIAVFAWLLVHRSELSGFQETRKQARTIIPSVSVEGQTDSAALYDSASFDESKAQPLVLLENDESFIQALTVDLNKDGANDQICAVKRVSEPNVFIIPGIQNPVTGEYARLSPHKTGITQTRTLLLYASDIIGDRSNCVILSGMTADSMQSLTVFAPMAERDGKTSLSVIADLRSDGPITIREVGRSDAYNLGVTNGESYPIVTYNSDPDAPDTLDQIERVYRWDRQLRRYDLQTETKIKGKKLENRLVQQLQGGTIESFEKYLNGLWYMQESPSGKGPRSIYFDSAMKEIVFHNDVTEEVFTRESGTARRYGAYLTTRNRSISSIRRLIDLELIGLDEVRVKVLEDVRLKIGVASDWDGVYRKMSSQTVMNPTDKTESLKKILLSSQDSWNSTDGRSVSFRDARYSSTLSGSPEEGGLAFLTVGGSPVLQFRPDEPSRRGTFYLIGYDPTTQGKDEHRLTLTEVTVTINGTNFAGSQPIYLARKIGR